MTTIQSYLSCRKAYKELMKKYNTRFKKTPDPVRKNGKVKVYTEEEIFLYKCRKFSALLDKSREGNHGSIS